MVKFNVEVVTAVGNNLSSIKQWNLFVVSDVVKVDRDIAEKCILLFGALRFICDERRGGSQSKHTRSILIPRSVAVNVEAEVEYISQRVMKSRWL